MANVKPLLWLAALLALIFAPVFYMLGYLPLQLWDEARIANSALEMMHNHNWLVVYFNGLPDMWSVKPPMLVWMQVLSMNVFGISEFATRFPAALAAAVTCLAIFQFFYRRLRMPLMGLIAVYVLVTSGGFIMLHGSRTGDYDPVLTCFTTLYVLNYYIYVTRGTPRHLYAFFAFLALAVLTKGIAAMLMLPGLLIFTLYKKRLVSQLAKKELYIGSAFFILIAGGYYLLRNHYNPGYLASVWLNEMGGRFASAKEQHSGVFLYYINCLVKYQFKYWYLFYPAGFYFGVFVFKGPLKDFTIFLTITSLTFLLVISSAQTKLFWYAMPVIPLLAILPGIFIYFLATTFWYNSKIVNKFITGICLLAIFTVPYYKIVYQNTHKPTLPRWLNENTDMATFMQAALQNREDVEGCTFTWTDYQANILWYYKALKYQHKDVTFAYGNRYDGIKKLVAFTPDTKKYIEDHYQARIIKTYKSVTVYTLNGTR